MTLTWRKAITNKTKYAIQFANNRAPENLELKRKYTNIATRESGKTIISFWFAKSEELKSNQGSVFNTFRLFISSKTKDSNMICLQSEGCRVEGQIEVAEQLANYFTTAAKSIAEDHVTSIREENLDNHCSINAIREASLRCMAILSSRAHEWRSREIRARSARERAAKPREKVFQVALAPIFSRFLCPRSPLLLGAPNQNRHATQASTRCKRRWKVTRLTSPVDGTPEHAPPKLLESETLKLRHH